MTRATEQDLKARTTALLDEVESGHTVEVTRDGKVVARLIPAAARDWPDFEARLKQTYPAGAQGKPIGEIVDEARGDRP